MAVNELVLTKVRKLLALAGNNPNQAEAFAAMAKAQALMAEHAIALGDVETQEVRVVRRDLHIDVTGDREWQHHLANVVAKNFRVASFYCSDPTGARSQVIMGDAADVDMAEPVIRFSIQAALLGFVSYQVASGSASATEQRSYFRGFTQGLAAHFAEQVQRNQWGLTLALHPVVAQAVEQVGLRTVPSGFRTSATASSTAVGFRDGKAAGGRHGRQLDA